MQLPLANSSRRNRTSRRTWGDSLDAHLYIRLFLTIPCRYWLSAPQQPYLENFNINRDLSEHMHVPRSRSLFKKFQHGQRRWASGYRTSEDSGYKRGTIWMVVPLVALVSSYLTCQNPSRLWLFLQRFWKVNVILSCRSPVSVLESRPINKSCMNYITSSK